MSPTDRLVYVVCLCGVQVVKSEVFPSNPEGCWDWWGYTDSNYSNKNGVQIKFVEAIMTKIMGGSP